MQQGRLVGTLDMSKISWNIRLASRTDFLTTMLRYLLFSRIPSDGTLFLRPGIVITR